MCPAWSPDGSRILYIADRREDNDLDDRPELWTIPAGGGEPTRIEAPAGPKEAVAWSPDGKWIAYVGHIWPDDTWGGRNERVMLIPAGGAAEAKDLTGDTDKAVGYLTLADNHESGGGLALIWAPDSESIYFPISEQGATLLYRVNRDGSGLTALTPADKELCCFSMSADGQRFGVTLGDAVEFADAFIGGVGDWKKVSDLNRSLKDEVDFQMPEEVRIQSDGGEVHAWILRPTDFNESRKYPMVVYVHGGPALQYGGKSAPLHEHQWLAANGYVVIFANPRGSKGYGEAHTMAIHGDWGNKDWIDVQAVADYGCSLPYVDSTRTAIMGGSYGGFMTAWAVGHSERFRCAITDRLVGNIHSFSGTVDFAWEHGKFYKGNAWDDPSDMWRCSPLAYAGRINTPLMIVHSDGDLRCPVSQAEELFAALRMQRKEVEFVRYPAESSHGLSRNGPPDLRLDRLRRNLAWLDKYMKGK
jgi:dipeptidyl aminopeptidase/acylaminoacyl peptidase